MFGCAEPGRGAQWKQRGAFGDGAQGPVLLPDEISAEHAQRCDIGLDFCGLFSVQPTHGGQIKRIIRREGPDERRSKGCEAYI
jgi:hypothetical protein